MLKACQKCRWRCRDSKGVDQLSEDVPVVALAGNPNTGKSTLFNRLTGLRQHTGNWPGKTVLKAEGIAHSEHGSFRIIDLPGTYTLLAASAEERLARDFICFGKPDATIVIVDAMALERNLSLVLQVMEITSKAIVCVNLIDEAHRKGVHVDTVALEKHLGIPVVATSARNGTGIDTLLAVVADVVSGRRACQPRVATYGEDLERAISDIEAQIDDRIAAHVNRRWLALRLLEGDQTVIEALSEHLGLHYLGPSIAPISV